MKNTTDYSVNKAAVNAWFDCVDEDPTNSRYSIVKAKLVRRHLRHVSFNEFHTKLLSIRKSLMACIRQWREKLTKQDRAVAKIYVALLAGYKKSNTWVMMLLFDESLWDAVDCVAEFVNVGFPNENAIPPNQKAFIIIPEDMSYSGGQLYPLLQTVMTADHQAFLAIPYVAVRAVKTLMRYGDDYKDLHLHNIIIPDEVEYVLGLADVIALYTSHDPTDVWLTNIYLNLPQSHIELLKQSVLGKAYNFIAYVFDHISEVFDGDLTEEEISVLRTNNPGIGSLENVFKRDWSTGQLLIYFDHKIADQISIHQRLLECGTCTTQKYIGSLIKSCNPQKACAEQRWIEDFNQLKNEDACPVTFYKRVNWLYRGNTITFPTSTHLADVVKQCRRYLW